MCSHARKICALKASHAWKDVLLCVKNSCLLCVQTVFSVVNKPADWTVRTSGQGPIGAKCYTHAHAIYVFSRINSLFPTDHRNSGIWIQLQNQRSSPIYKCPNALRSYSRWHTYPINKVEQTMEPSTSSDESFDDVDYSNGLTDADFSNIVIPHQQLQRHGSFRYGVPAIGVLIVLIIIYIFLFKFILCVDWKREVSIDIHEIGLGLQLSWLIDLNISNFMRKANQQATYSLSDCIRSIQEGNSKGKIPTWGISWGLKARLNHNQWIYYDRCVNWHIHLQYR